MAKAKKKSAANSRARTARAGGSKTHGRPGAGEDAAAANRPCPEGTGQKMEPPASGVTVRMYRTGLGDCFLLAFPLERTAEGRDAFYVLIDCGVFLVTKTGPDGTVGDQIPAADWMRCIARDIQGATGGRIDLVMITHEHWDHVSGFHEDQAQAVFAQIEIGALWLPWTEDQSIPLAKKLKQEGGAAALALGRAAEELERRNLADSSTAGLVDKVLGFFGAAKSSKYSKKTGEAMDWVQKTWAKKATTKYLHPGDGPLALEGVADARLYVLGPPEDESVIKLLDRAGDSYRMGAEWPAAAACFLAFGVVPAGADDEVPTEEDIAEARRMSIPFEERHQIRQAGVEKRIATGKAGGGMPERDAFFRDHYLHGEDWRRIDGDWAAPAGAFALQLDNKTNNTSLAFALEIGEPGQGKVVLFPGDAQIGNWLSWFGPVKVRGADKPIGEALAWKVGGKTVTAEDLLDRTVLYKVGHHGSHNATLRAIDGKPGGLQLMGALDGKKDFAAMIPVDEFVAHAKAGYGEMPKPGIVQDLLRRSGGRVMRNDEDAHAQPDAPTLQGTGFPADVPKPKPKFPGKNKTDYFIEYTVL